MTVDQLQIALNNQVSNLNQSVFKLSTYLEDWATLPAGVKTAVKSVTATKIDAVIAQLSSLKTDINAL